MKGLKDILYIGVAALLLTTAIAHAGVCSLAGRIDDRVIVAVRPGETINSFLNQFATNHPDIPAVVSDQVPGRALYLVQLTLPPDFSPADADALELSLKTDYTTIIRYGEILYTDETPEGTTGSTLVDGIADIGNYQGQYARTRINADAANTMSTGNGVVVAIVDTGVDSTHPLLAPMIAPGGFNFVENNTNTADVGTNSDNDNDGQIDEGVGHGTFVAGLVTLVAPQAKILPIRVLDGEGNGDLWTLTRGIFHAVDRGVEVINVSISSTYNSAAVEDALNEAEDLGIVVVAAAGNCNNDDPREYPAMRSGALGVLAVNHNDVKAPFSNYSDRLFICAPGDSALEGTPDNDRSIISLTPGGNMAYWEGTSMAAPLVSGTVALIRAQHPEWPHGAIAVAQVENILENSAVNIYPQNPGYNNGELGVGRVNAGAAVALGPVAPKLGDLDADGVVNVSDLFALLSDWTMAHSSADLNGDGNVNVVDLFILLANWG